jgi:peroxiredoxin Q/BCP
MKKVIEKYPNKEGKKAGVFCLLDQNENKVCLKRELESLEKNNFVLLFFYPKDMTPGCTIEAIDLSEAKRKLKNKGVKVFGISKLPVKSKIKFIEKNNLKIDLLSDEDLKVCDKYGV